MAILKQRLHRKNSSGSYDTVYLENIATNIKMSETDSTTVATAINNRLPLSGGTLTGNLTGQYIIGTWLKTTEVTDKAGDIATIDSDGWIYKRTPAEIRSDIGAQPAGSYAAASHNHSAANITSGTLAVARGGTGQTSVDTTPTSGSKKMCTSGGIYTAINELKTSVSNGKSLIASAITDKGVSTASNATFQTMSNNIRSIQTAAGSIYDITAHDGTLFDNETNASYFPFLMMSGNSINVKAIGSSIRSWSDVIIHFGIRGANYTKVWAYENNSYSSGESFSMFIYEYDPFDLSTLTIKNITTGKFNSRYSAQELGFTMSTDKVYLIAVKDSGVEKQYIKFIT